MFQLFSFSCAPSPSRAQALHRNLQLPGYFFPEISWETWGSLTVGYHGQSLLQWGSLKYSTLVGGIKHSKSACWGLQDGMICPSSETPSWTKAAPRTGLALHVLYWTTSASSCNMVFTSKIQMGNHAGQCCSRRKGWGMSCWYPGASTHSSVWNRPSYPGASEGNTYFNLCAQGWHFFFSLAYHKCRYFCYWYKCPILFCKEQPFIRGPELPIALWYIHIFHTLHL